MNKLKVENKQSSIRVMWGVVCSLSSIDQQKNNISLFNVITQLNVPKSDFDKAKQGGHKGLAIVAPHEVVVMFRRIFAQGVGSDELNVDVKVSFVNPSGQVIGEVLSPIKFLPNVKTHGHRINFNNFPIQGEGSYEYRVSIMERGEKYFTQIFTIPLSVETII
jgi:hypothetical protein